MRLSAALWLLAFSAFALPSDTLVVSVKHAPPFVFADKSGVKPRGFSIDIIEEIARTMSRPRSVRYRVDSDLVSHLESVQSGAVDLGIAATTITSQREREIDFSQPFFQDRLGLLTPKQSWLRRIFLRIPLNALTFLPQISGIVGAFLAYLLIFAHLIWGVERGATFDKRYLAGIAQAMWWTVVTMSTVGYGDFAPRKGLGRAIAVVVMFSGVALFGVAIATLSSFLTIAQLQTDIQSLKDLEGRTVAVVEGSVGAAMVDRLGANALPSATLDEAFGALRRRKAAALVHDASLIQYYMKTKASKSAGYVLITEGLRQFDYGIAFPKASPLREEVNVALLGMMEGEEPAYKAIYDAWFTTQ